MAHAPHELSEEFPDKLDRIHDLKVSDAHFRRLAREYEAVNLAVHRAEANLDPTDELHETELRKNRLALKDQIARMLA